MIYLDHAATTALDPRALDAMMPFLREGFGNASSVHRVGQDARRAVDRARNDVAALIGARADEIIFTSGGTEADNLAVFGLTGGREDNRRHVVTSAIEHHAVLHAMAHLAELGYELTIVAPGPDGHVDPGAIAAALRQDTALCSVMLANNETGTLQDVAAMAKAAHDVGALFHTDAVQAAGLVPVDVQALGVDALTLTGHKFYGPKGAGALYLRRGTRIAPTQRGGAHERGRRAGTENVPAIVGLGAAARLALEDMGLRAERMVVLRDRLWLALRAVPGAHRNGDPERCLPGHLNVRFDGVDGEAAVLNLDLRGIAASMGSACSSGSLEASHVLLALGLSHADARGGIRLTLGRETTEAEVDAAAVTLREIVERQRALSAARSG
ncbi:MAG: cysteine desulfurase family protein [Thermaerobacter sp.]|nr:cysteine desulfurase family protein [Thermaerobacter sp.]